MARPYNEEGKLKQVPDEREEGSGTRSHFLPADRGW